MPKVRFQGHGKEPVDFYIWDEETLYLPLSFAKRLFPDAPSDKRWRRCRVRFTGTFRDEQPAVYAEALCHLQERQTVTVCLPPGSGKTVIAIALASKLRYITIILITLETLIVQWRKTIRKFTDGSCWVVGEGSYNGEPFIICMNRRIRKIPRKILQGIGTMIIDEVHLFCTQEKVGQILRVCPNHIISLSATPKRADGLHLMTIALCGTHMVVRRNYIPPTVYYVKTGITGTETERKQGWWTRQEASIILNPERDIPIYTAVRRFSSKKILVITKRLEHVDRLCTGLRNRGEDYDYLTGDHKEFRNCRVLVAIDKKAGVGFDLATNCEDYDNHPIEVVIICFSLKDEPLLEQIVGRAMRSKQPVVVQLQDDDPTVMSHLQQNLFFYKDIKGTVSYLELAEEDRTIICGSTNLTKPRYIRQAVERSGFPFPSRIICGTRPGVDQLAVEYAEDYGIIVDVRDRNLEKRVDRLIVIYDESDPVVEGIQERMHALGKPIYIHHTKGRNHS